MSLGSEQADGDLKSWFETVGITQCLCPFEELLCGRGKRLKKKPSCCVPLGIASL